MNSKRWKKFLFCSDLHGDMQDRGTVETLLAFKNREWKPDITVFGGDLWDFRSIRRKATEEDKRDSLIYDYECGLDFLKLLRPNYFLRGNHDERLWYWRDHGAGVVQDFAGKVISEIGDECAKLKCHMFPYTVRKNVLRIGRLKMMHGFWCGAAAPKQAVQWAGACLYGHTHTIQLYSEPTYAGPKVGRGVGCMCNLNMEYESVRPGSTKSAHGWAYGFIDTVTGAYKVYQAEQLGGTWLLATKFAEFR